jgi:mannose/fructose/N-acetylgalactosamine-specific phosphotransferase system component IIB
MSSLVPKEMMRMSSLVQKSVKSEMVNMGSLVQKETTRREMTNLSSPVQKEMMKFEMMLKIALLVETKVMQLRMPPMFSSNMDFSLLF